MAPRFTGVGMLPVPAIPTVGDRIQPSHVAELYSLVRVLFHKLNGKLNLVGTGEDGTQAGNADAEALDVFFPTANAEVAIPHDLERVPQGYIVVRRDAACSIYDSNNASWTEKVIFLKSNTAGVNVKILVV